MKILQIITRLDKGGSAELTLQLCAGLAQRGHEVILISGKTVEPAWNAFEYGRQHHFQVEFVNSLVRNINPLSDLVALFELYTDIQRIKPDIVHTNSSKAGIIGRLAAYAAGVKCIYHSPHGHIFYGYYNRFVSQIFILIEKLTAHFTAKIFNLTEAGRRDHIIEKVARPEKFTVSSCGIDLSPYSEIKIKETNSDKLIVAWIGRIVPIKNLSMLIAAAQILKDDPRFEFRIIGDGEELEKFQMQVQAQALENVHFLGYKYNLAEELAQCDLFVLTSLNEGFGRVIVEAMAAGLPVIATRVGGVPVLIQPDKNGYLISSGNAAELAERLDYLAKNPEIRKTIGKFNRDQARYYSIENYIDRIEAVYNLTM